jgi:outer membrane protein TolC
MQRPSSTAGRHGMRRALVAAAALLLLAALPARAALSLDDAVRLAARDSRAIAATQAQASAARELAVAAGQRPDPVFKAGINNLPIDGRDRFTIGRDFMTMRSIGVMQELTRQDKRQARSARAASEVDVADASRAATTSALQRDAAMAWLERHFLERTQALIQRQRDEAQLQVQAADAAYRGGRGAQAELFAARSEVARIDDRAKDTLLQIAVAKTRLARWIGSQAEQPLDAAPDLSRPPFDEDRLQREIEHTPQIVLAASQERVARAEVELAQANLKPDWSVELMYSQRGSAFSNMVSINLAIPLHVDRGQRQERELAARMAQLEQAKALREDAERMVLADARVALQQWRSRRERAVHYETTLVELAAERTRAALAAYRGGSAALGAVLDARRNELDTRVERLRLEMEAAALWAQLAYLFAADVKDKP